VEPSQSSSFLGGGRGNTWPPILMPRGLNGAEGEREDAQAQSGGTMATNPRYKNGSRRRKHRERFKAMNAPCGICGGRLGPIHYDEPSDAKHPLSFVIDERHPVSKWRQFGYDSPEAAAKDWNNLQAAHYCCNQAKGNKTGFQKIIAVNQTSGQW